jgi:hypothetical protein
MQKTFGKAYSGLDLKRRGPGSLFMESFEQVKKNFGHRDNEKAHFEVNNIDMELDAYHLKYDADEAAVKIPRCVLPSMTCLVFNFSYRHEMIGFFEPAIRGLTHLLDDQVAQLANKSRGAKIDVRILIALLISEADDSQRMILVGGFGDSPYLYSKLNDWRKKQGIKHFTCPPDW